MRWEEKWRSASASLPWPQSSNATLLSDVAVWGSAIGFGKPRWGRAQDRPRCAFGAALQGGKAWWCRDMHEPREAKNAAGALPP